MHYTDETVHDRIGRARRDLSPVQLAVGIAFGVALAYALLFLNDPMAHDAMHDFRHAAGITCH